MRESFFRIICAIILSLIFVPHIAKTRAQETQGRQDPQDEVIRVRTELVQVRAVVTDKKGQLVDGLKREDFEVLENGRPQDVSFFTVEHLRGETSAEASGANQTTVAGNNPSATRPALPARSIVLFVDTLHLTPLSLMRAKKQLKQFIDEQMTDQDTVAIVTTSGTLGALQQFMRDRRMLKYAIDKITSFPKPQSLFSALLASRVLSEDPAAIQVAIQIISAEEGFVSLSAQAGRAYAEARAQQVLAQESNLRRATLQILKGVSDQLAALRGQRIIALVSDGFSLLDSNGGFQNQELRAATSSASRQGVVIYSLNAKGLTAPAEFSAATSLSGVEFSNFMSQSQLDEQDTLKTLAYDTGGEAFINRNDMKGMLQSMLDSNQVYYAIAYYPQDKDKKKFRNITLRVKNHPDYKVRAQKGYQPSEEKPEEVASTPQQKLLQAMIAPLPLTNINVVSSADFLVRETDDAQATLKVHFDGNLLDYQKQERNYLLNCQIAVAIFDRDGKISDSFSEEVKSNLTAEQVEKAKQNGYRYNKRLNLKPGLYQVRIGVRDANSGLIGTSMSWIEVPDLQNKKLALSSLFLGKGPTTTETAGVAGASSARTNRPKLILGTASFKRGESFFYRFVAYNAADLESGLQLKVEIMQGETTVYDSAWQPLASRLIRKDRKGIEVGGQIKLGLDSGVYVLRVSVKDTKSKKTAQQIIDFEIEP